MKLRSLLMIALMTALVLATAFAGGQSEAAEEGGGAEETKTIAVIVPPVENPFFGTMQDMAAAKAEELGYETVKLVHDDDATKQMEQFESMIAQGVSAIIEPV